MSISQSWGQLWCFLLVCRRDFGGGCVAWRSLFSHTFLGVTLALFVPFKPCIPCIFFLSAVWVHPKAVESWWQPPKQIFHIYRLWPLCDFRARLPWSDALFSWLHQQRVGSVGGSFHRDWVIPGSCCDSGCSVGSWVRTMVALPHPQSPLGRAVPAPGPAWSHYAVCSFPVASPAHPGCFTCRAHQSHCSLAALEPARAFSKKSSMWL